MPTHDGEPAKPRGLDLEAKVYRGVDFDVSFAPFRPVSRIDLLMAEAKQRIARGMVMSRRRYGERVGAVERKPRVLPRLKQRHKGDKTTGMWNEYESA